MSFSRKQAFWSIFLSPFLNGRVASFLLEDYIPSFGAEREHSKKKKKRKVEYVNSLSAREFNH